MKFRIVFRTFDEGRRDDPYREHEHEVDLEGWRELATYITQDDRKYVDVIRVEVLD